MTEFFVDLFADIFSALFGKKLEKKRLFLPVKILLYIVLIAAVIGFSMIFGYFFTGHF